MIKDLWRYAFACYREPKTAPLFVEDPVFFYSSVVDETDFIMIVEEPKRVVFAIRGTAGPQDGLTRFLKGWLNNVSVFDRDGRSLYSGMADGFENTANDFAKVIHLNWQRWSGKKWFVTGHSRGGAEAICLGYFMYEQYRKNATVVTFGAPNVTNHSMTEFIALKGLRIYNVYTKYDIVYRTPPLFYKPGFHIPINTSPILPVPALFKRTRGILDHLPKTYDKFISKNSFAGVIL